MFKKFRISLHLCRKYSDGNRLPRWASVFILFGRAFGLILATNLGVPHFASEADIYNGYFIPKGTIVIGNTW